MLRHAADAANQSKEHTRILINLVIGTAPRASCDIRNKKPNLQEHAPLLNRKPCLPEALTQFIYCSYKATARRKGRDGRLQELGYEAEKKHSASMHLYGAGLLIKLRIVNRRRKNANMQPLGIRNQSLLLSAPA